MHLKDSTDSLKHKKCEIPLCVSKKSYGESKKITLGSAQ